MIRTTPFFCHTNMRPSGAKAKPTSVNGGTVATVSVANPDAVNVSAAALGTIVKDTASAARRATNVRIGRLSQRRAAGVNRLHETRISAFVPWP